MELFKGFVPTKNKKCLMTFKNKGSEDLLSYDEVKSLPEYAGILAENTILVDIDDKEQSEILMNIVEDLQLNCRVYMTTRGRHFLFKNNGVDSCGTHVKLACGLDADIKVGVKNSYSVLKYDNKERFIEWDTENKGEYDLLPKWLLRVKNNFDFLTMSSGDGRNQALFNYILSLQSAGFTKDEVRECLRIINKYILKTPLSDNELDVVMRDDAFKESEQLFFIKGVFQFDKFATYIMNEYHIVSIHNMLHIYKDGVYVYGGDEIEAIMIKVIPNLKDTQRKEVLKYLDLIAPKVEVADANYIPFKNGVYNILTGILEPYNAKLILTNKIPHNYVKSAYNELTDKTLNKLACNDMEIRSLLEEYIGYNFYRRQELGKAFVLVGDKANGKSTFLDMVRAMLGNDNTSSLDLNELGDRFSTEMLFGKLANIGDDISDEFSQGRVVAMFKKIVTGNRVKVEKKGKDPRDVSVYCKMAFSCNDMPKIKDRTGAVLRRLVMIPFNATFSKDDADYDPFIKYKLIEEDSLEYLINLGILGLQRVLENNAFTRSQKVEERLEEYNVENNPLLAFIDSVDIAEIDDHITSEVYLKYDAFCHLNKFTALSNISFSKQICRELNMHVVSQRVNGRVVRKFVEN